MKPTQAMLMAAGLGTRLKPFTDVEPKAFLPVMGVPAAQFAMDALNAAGVKTVVANVHHHAGKSRAYLQRLAGKHTLRISDESEKLLGSAGGLRLGLEAMERESFYLVNADVITDFPLTQLATRHRELRSRWGVELTLTVFSGECAPSAGKYREIKFDPASGLMTELIDPPRANVNFFMGSAIIEPEALLHLTPNQPAEFIPDVLLPALRRKKVGVHYSRGLWMDIGSPELWLEAHLRMISALETGALAESIRERIEARFRRVAQGVWIKRGKARVLNRSGWVGPTFLELDHYGETRGRDQIGPNAVIYGNMPRLYEGEIRDGIGYGGNFVRCSPRG